MFERYTEKARRVIFYARYEASQFGSPYIEVEHLLLGLLHEDNDLAAKAGIHPEQVRKEIESRLPKGENINVSVDLPLSRDAKLVLSFAAEEAELLGHQQLDCGHLLLGLFRVKGGAPAQILNAQGVQYDKVREMIRAAPLPQFASAGSQMAVQSRPFNRGGQWFGPSHPVAPAFSNSVQRLRTVIGGAASHLDLASEDYGEQVLKRKQWTRKQAVGHLIDWAGAHQQWVIRAVTENRLAAPGYPAEDWVAFQRYDEAHWPDVVGLWLSLNQLLIHVISGIPEEKAAVRCRVGIAEPVTLNQLIENYVVYLEDWVSQILALLQ